MEVNAIWSQVAYRSIVPDIGECDSLHVGGGGDNSM